MAIGIFASIGLIIFFMKSPDFIKRVLMKFPFFTELVTTVFFFYTITGITASADGVLGAFMASFIWSTFFFVYKSQSKLVTE